MRALAFLLATALPLAAQAPAPVAATQAPAPASGDHPHGHGARLAQALGLTPDQQAKLQAIRDKHQAAMTADRAAARAQGQAFHAAMQDPKASEAQLRQAFDQMNAQRFQTLLERRALRQEMRAVLTPDQQAKAEAMRATFRDRMKARRASRHARWTAQEETGNP